MRIVYLSTTGELGGAELCLLDLVAVLRTAWPAWELQVIVGDDGPMRAAVDAIGVPCTVLALPGALGRAGDSALAMAGRGRGGASRLGLAARGPGIALATGVYLRGLRHRLRAEAPDCVHTNAMKAHVLAAWAAPRGTPVVWNLQDYAGTRPVMSRLLRWAARNPLEVVGASRSVSEDAMGVLDARVPVRTIYDGIDLERFAPGPGEPARLDEAAGLMPAPPGTIRVGLVATFARWKGQGIFLEAVARVPADRPCRFYVVGGPIYRSTGSQYTLDELRGRAHSLGLGSRLGFTGYMADPVHALRSLDVVVHASTRPEPFGRVIVEAMACGRAVIVAPIGGAAELFDDGVSALACPAGDPDALSAAMVRLVDHAELRRRLGAGGRAAALARFGRERLIGPWSALYEELAARAAPDRLGRRPSWP